MTLVYIRLIEVIKISKCVKIFKNIEILKMTNPQIQNRAAAIIIVFLCLFGGLFCNYFHTE